MTSVLCVAIAAGSVSARAQAMGKATVDAAGLAPASPQAAPVPMAAPAWGASVVQIAPAAAAPVPAAAVAPASQVASAPVPAVVPAAVPQVAVVPAPTSVAPAPTIAAAAASVPAAPVSDKIDGPAILPPVDSGASDAAGKPGGSIEQSSIRRGADAEGGPTVSAPLAPAKSGWGNLAQVGAALAVVVGLILIGRALVKRFVPGAGVASGKGVIEVLARHSLTKNQSIVLVRIGSQIVALNQGKEASESVLVISDATEVAKIIGQIEGKSPNSASAGFNNLLANARMDLEQNGESEEKSIDPETLDEQLEEMAAAKRQLMELRQHVRSVRDSLPT